MGLLSTFSAASGRAFGFTRSAIAAATDAFFNRVTLLLPGNGTNGAQNNTFLDSSSNNFTITRNGNTTQGAFSPFSQTGWSNYFNGSSDYLTTPDAAAFDFGTGDFTIEFFVYIAANSSADASSERRAAIITSLGTGSAADSGFAVYIDGNASTTGIGISFENRINSTTTYSVSATTTVSQNAWNHIAVVRSGTTTAFYLNGTSVGSGTLTNQTITSSQTINIGRLNVTGYLRYLNGYLSNLRVVKGTAVYTGAFTAPTAALTAITNTSLLTCQSNRFIDNSSNAFAITVNGTPSVQAFSPFAPTAAYSAATNGGSGYFDGTGDYLTLPNDANLDLASGDFTVEAWFYATASSGDRPIVQRFNGNLTIDRSQQQYEIRYNNGTLLIAPMIGTTNYEMSFASVPINQWNHCALVRTGNNFYAYLNGVRNATTRTISGSMNTGTWLTYIGYWAVSGSGSFFNGFISDVRINKGQALYTGATYTVPTAPLTTTSQSSTATNVELLTNFTNAGITDATAKNVLETVGNAQISTTQSKFGGASISFDGTGDWLLLPHTVDQMLGTGAFTIEMWIYRNASGTYGLVGKGTGTTGWLVSLNSSNQVVFTYGSSTITSTGTISATTWTYIAVVREGTGTNQTKIYISGSNDGTGTVSTDFNQTNAMYVGADRTGGSAFNGYIDDLRITKGYARTIATPSSAFPLQ